MMTASIMLLAMDLFNFFQPLDAVLADHIYLEIAYRFFNRSSIFGECRFSKYIIVILCISLEFHFCPILEIWVSFFCLV